VIAIPKVSGVGFAEREPYATNQRKRKQGNMLTKNTPLEKKLRLRISLLESVTFAKRNSFSKGKIRGSVVIIAEIAFGMKRKE
jgi:hypothetical protein